MTISPSRLHWLLRLMLMFCLLGTAWGSGCVLDRLSLDCYSCPCGSPDYVCVSGFCISKSTQAQLTPTQLTRHVIDTCQSYSGDGGGSKEATPTEPGVVCACPEGYLCDPQTGACTNPCEDVPCPDGYRCFPRDGKCERERIDTNDCRQNASLCQPPGCCHPGIGACVEDCRTCDRCAEGYVCDERNGRCVRETTTCEPAPVCETFRDCCERTCYRINARGYRFGSCQCRVNGDDCPRGQRCLPVTDARGQITYTCTCLNNSQCGPNALCLGHPAWLGVKTCALP